MAAQEEPHKHDDDSDGEITEAEKNQLKLLPDNKPIAGTLNQEDLERAKVYLSKVTGVEIKVEGAKEVKGGAFSKNYIVYEVRGADKNGPINVNRRYREFDALRNKLKHNWPGVFIPSIPEKKAVNNADVTAHRLLFLDHFLKKCARLEHIFYSEEMQLFLRSTSSDDLVKAIDAIPNKSSSELMSQYKHLFPEFTQDSYSKETEERVTAKINAMKEALTEVKDMRKTLKTMEGYRQSMKTTKADLAMLVAHHAFGKVKDKEAVNTLNAKVKIYQDVEKKEDIKQLYWNLKILMRDLESFLLLPNDLVLVQKQLQVHTTLVNETSSQYQAVMLSDKDIVNDGLFKKVSKQAKLQELDKILDKAKEELTAATELVKFLYVLMDKHEVPLIEYIKAMGLADGIMELSRQRTDALKQELDILELFSKEISAGASAAPAGQL